MPSDMLFKKGLFAAHSNPNILLQLLQRKAVCDALSLYIHVTSRHIRHTTVIYSRATQIAYHDCVSQHSDCSNVLVVQSVCAKQKRINARNPTVYCRAHRGVYAYWIQNRKLHACSVLSTYMPILPSLTVKLLLRNTGKCCVIRNVLQV